MFKTFQIVALVTCVSSLFSIFASQTQADSPTGRWRGQWHSQATGHHGSLNANIRPNSDGSYSARFYGRFAAVIPFTYKVDLQPDGGGGYYSQKTLGPISGTARMDMNFGSSAMNGGYSAMRDHGGVSMNRVR
jgi:hypothetical protein